METLEVLRFFKEKALARKVSSRSPPTQYKPDDAQLAFLESLRLCRAALSKIVTMQAVNPGHAA